VLSVTNAILDILGSPWRGNLVVMDDCIQQIKATLSIYGITLGVLNSFSVMDAHWLVRQID
jgi:hypothetical protein